MTLAYENLKLNQYSHQDNVDEKISPINDFQKYICDLVKLANGTMVAFGSGITHNEMETKLNEYSNKLIEYSHYESDENFESESLLYYLRIYGQLKLFLSDSLKNQYGNDLRNETTKKQQYPFEALLKVINECTEQKFDKYQCSQEIYSCYNLSSFEDSDSPIHLDENITTMDIRRMEEWISRAKKKDAQELFQDILYYVRHQIIIKNRTIMSTFERIMLYRCLKMSSLL